MLLSVLVAVEEMKLASGGRDSSLRFLVIHLSLITCLQALVYSPSILALAEVVGAPHQLPSTRMQEIISKVKTQVPVIGVLTEVLRDYKRFSTNKHLHIAASYVKWIESAGAQVLPVHLNRDDAYYELVFRQTNGLVFPGGDNLLDPNKATPMMEAAKRLYKLAVEANNRGDYYPIWGTCLGLELLTVLTSNKNMLDNCSANEIALLVEFRERGKLFSPFDYADLGMGIDYAGLMMKTMSNKNVTYNYHHKCLTDLGLRRANLENFYRPLGYSKDKNGLKFIAVMEAIDYPFYGVQFHPEKPPFEFEERKGSFGVPHSREAIAVSRFFGDFFIAQAQLSSHKAPFPSQLALSLIYSYKPEYTALKGDIYEQRYLFPYTERKTITSEEFLEFVPNGDDEIPEDVTLNV